MHPTMSRLYQATTVDGKAPTQAEIARRLDTTSQAVNNWETRGISHQGAQKAQRVFGVNAAWILTGSGPVRVSSQPVGLDVAKLADLIETVEASAIQARRDIPPRTKARILASLYASNASREAVDAALVSIFATMED